MVGVLVLFLKNEPRSARSREKYFAERYVWTKRAITMKLHDHLNFRHKIYKTQTSNTNTISMKDNKTIKNKNNTHHVFRLPLLPPTPPLYRAMAMVARPEPSLFRSPADAHTKSSTSGKQPGLVPGSGSVPTHDHDHHHAGQGSWTMDPSNSDANTSSNANVNANTTVIHTIPTTGWQNAVLTRLGLYHPLEQCQTTFPKAKLPIVLNSLTNAFQALSLQTTFQSTPIAANCTSLEQVHWRVSLWESRSDPDTCIAEVQRCKGDSITFCAYAKQILGVVVHAASAATAPFAPTAAQPMYARTLSMPTLVQAERMLAHTFCSQEQQQQQEQQNDATAYYRALEIADTLIHADRLDAHCLGLESLGILTDPEKTGMAGAKLVAAVVLTGRAVTLTDDDDEAADVAVYQRLQHAVVTAVMTGNGNNSNGMLERDVDRMDTDDDSNHVSYYLALVICANAVSVLSLWASSSASSQDAGAAAKNQEVLEQFLVDTERLTGHSLLDTLVGQVHVCQEQAHLAYLAARILHGLCLASPRVRADLKMKMAVPVVQHAQQVGSVTHAALEQITGRLLVAMHA
jgi:hypothetical protein